MTQQRVSDIEGPWVDPELNTGLTDRCKKNWDVPASELPDVMIATYLTQRIAVNLMLCEAERRINAGILDDSELYDGQLAETVQRARSNQND